MPETFVLYAYSVPKPDVVIEPEARCIEWMDDLDGFIDTEAFAH